MEGTLMNVNMINDIAESRGYDRGLRDACEHQIGIVSQYIEHLENTKDCMVGSEKVSSQVASDIKNDITLQIISLYNVKRLLRNGSWNARDVDN